MHKNRQQQDCPCSGDFKLNDFLWNWEKNVLWWTETNNTNTASRGHISQTLPSSTAFSSIVALGELPIVTNNSEVKGKCWLLSAARQVVETWRVRRGASICDNWGNCDRKGKVTGIFNKTDNNCYQGLTHREIMLLNIWEIVLRNSIPKKFSTCFFFA